MISMIPNCIQAAESAYESSLENDGGHFCLFLRQGVNRSIDLLHAHEIDVEDLRAHVIVEKAKNYWLIRRDCGVTKCKESKLMNAILCAFRREMCHRYGSKKYFF